jgi:large subunit ribosomal protein L4
MAKEKTEKTKAAPGIGEKLTREVNEAVIHRAVIAEQANKRQGTHKTKTRSEASGGGRKPYRQKKTGRARQGSIRAPHYAHGGMAHARIPVDHSLKVNRKERRLAILAALSAKAESGNLVIVDNISFSEIKTKQAVQFLGQYSKGVKRVLVILPEYDEVVYKSFRNLKNGNEQKVEVRTAPAGKGQESKKTQGFSARDVMVAHKVLVVKEALKMMEEAWS